MNNHSSQFIHDYYSVITSRQTNSEQSTTENNGLNASSFNAFSTPDKSNPSEIPPGLFSSGAHEKPTFQGLGNFQNQSQVTLGSQPQTYFRPTQMYPATNSSGNARLSSLMSGVLPIANQQQYYPGFSMRPSSSSTQTSRGESLLNSSGSLFLDNGNSSQLFREDSIANENVALELQRRELEVQTLKSEIEQLNDQVRKLPVLDNGVIDVEQSIKQAFDEKVKSLRERDAQIAKLTYQLESAMGVVSKPHLAKGSKLGNMQEPGQEALAHQIVSRISALRGENELFGVSKFLALRIQLMNRKSYRKSTVC